MYKRNKFGIDLPGWLIVLGIIIIIPVILIGLPYLGCYLAPKVSDSGIIKITSEQCFTLVTNILKAPLIIINIIKEVF
jgi:hypothetical protein